MKQHSFSYNSRIRSIRFALRGVKRFFREEPNAWVHLASTLLVILACFLFRVSSFELMLLVIVTAWVWFAEIINTAVERIADLYTTNKDHRIAFIKDLAAGAVLIAALTALVTGALIFIPKLIP